MSKGPILLTLDKNGEVKKERGPRIRNGYVPRLDKEEYLIMLGLSEAEQALCTLTDEELAFVCEMVSNGCDKIKAYATVNKITNGHLSKTQYNKVAEIIRKDEVKQLLRRGIQKKMSESLDNLDGKLLDTYIMRAFYDPADFIDDNGDPKTLSEIDENKRCVVDGVEKKYYGKDADEYTITLKLANRDQALKVLGEYTRVIRPNTEVMVTSTTKENEEDEAQRLAEMSYDELQAEMKRLQA